MPCILPYFWKITTKEAKSALTLFAFFILCMKKGITPSSLSLLGKSSILDENNKKGVKLSLSHASSLAGLVTQSGLETNASSRMMTHHPA